MAKKKGNTGKRYTVEQRQKILAFVQQQGRGGISAAIRKFGVSYIAMRSWMKTGPEGAKRGSGKAAKAGLDGRQQSALANALATAKSLNLQMGKLQLLLKKLSK